MQINQSPRFIKSFMIGLIASSAGAFVALPSVAMPETEENVAATEVVEDTAADSVEALPTPTAEETLPSPEEALEAADTPDAADLEADADVDVELTEETEAADVVAEESADETVEADAEVVDETVEADAEVVDETMEADAEVVDETVEADAEMVDETMEADAEMTDEAVEADAEMTDEAVEADAGEEIDTEAFTIAELTDNSDSFTILAAALAAADLTTVLAGEGPYTVFAPTDEAFEALPEGAIEQLLMPENKDVLVQVLSYHVVPGAMLSTDLASGDIATVEGSDVTLGVEADGVTVNNANVFVPDVKASNGVIHIIDSVIVPPVPESEADVEDVEAEPIQ